VRGLSPELALATRSCSESTILLHTHCIHTDFVIGLVGDGCRAWGFVIVLTAWGAVNHCSWQERREQMASLQKVALDALRLNPIMLLELPDDALTSCSSFAPCRTVARARLSLLRGDALSSLAPLPPS